jgi:hypothetical protein
MLLFPYVATCASPGRPNSVKRRNAPLRKFYHIFRSWGPSRGCTERLTKEGASSFSRALAVCSACAALSCWSLIAARATPRPVSERATLRAPAVHLWRRGVDCWRGRWRQRMRAGAMCNGPRTDLSWARWDTRTPGSRLVHLRCTRRAKVHKAGSPSISSQRRQRV